MQAGEYSHQRHSSAEYHLDSCRGQTLYDSPREMQVRRLHLTPDAHISSAELHTWCKSNRNRFYIPEWLLDDWGIAVDAELTGAA
jgi:hypothetical protein